MGTIALAHTSRTRISRRSFPDLIGIGEWAAMGTALAWTLSAMAWTAAGKRIGALATSFIRLIMASLLLAGYGQLVRGRWLPTDASPDTWLYLGLSGFLWVFRVRFTSLSGTCVDWPATGVVGPIAHAPDHRVDFLGLPGRPNRRTRLDRDGADPGRHQLGNPGAHVAGHHVPQSRRSPPRFAAGHCGLLCTGDRVRVLQAGHWRLRCGGRHIHSRAGRPARFSRVDHHHTTLVNHPRCRAAKCKPWPSSSTGRSSDRFWEWPCPWWPFGSATPVWRPP